MNECTNAHECRVGLYSTECTVYSQANHSRLTVLPQALFHSRQMEGNITTACTIAFIKQKHKGCFNSQLLLKKEKAFQESRINMI